MEARIAPAALAIGNIGTGLHKTSATFVDADGDRVDVLMVGGGTFDIALDGGKINKADIDHITINNATSLSSLLVKVQSRTVLNNRGLDTNFVTPGTTNINSITSDYTGTMKSLQLRSAEVQDIDLGNVSLSGGLFLQVSNASKADLRNERASGFSGSTYNPVTPGIDFNAIELASAGSITIRGAVGHANDLFSSNDFDGAIQVGGTLGKLVGDNSNLNGSVDVGQLDGVSVAALHGSLTSTGDMTLDLKSLEADSLVTVGGDLNLRLGYAGGNAATESGFFGTINVAGDISGLKTPVRTVGKVVAAGPIEFSDPILIRGNFAGSMMAGGDVSDVSIVSGAGITTGQFTGTLSSEGSIGNIYAQRGFTGGSNPDFQVSDQGNSSVSATGNIGNISSDATNSGTFFAGGSIGDINANATARFTDAIANARFVAQGSIGDITARSFSGHAISFSDVESLGSDIGVTTATVTNLTGDTAISNVDYTAAFGHIGDISAASAGLHGISGFSVEASSVGNILGVAQATSSGDGINNLDVTADDSIGTVTGNAMGAFGGGGIISAHLQVQGGYVIPSQTDGPFLQRSSSHSRFEEGATIGDIHGTTNGYGFGIQDLNAHAGDGIGDVIGEVISKRGEAGLENITLSSGGSVGQVVGFTVGSGNGLHTLNLQANGTVNGIVGDAGEANSGANGIADVTVLAGQISFIAGRSGSTVDTAGIRDSSFTAEDIGPIDALSQSQGASHAILKTSFTGSQIGAITAEASNGGAEAIASVNFNAANVGLITATSNGNVDHSIIASIIGTADRGFNYGGVVSNHSVDLAFKTTGGAGTLGTIDILGDLDAAALGGVTTLTKFSVSGAVKGNSSVGLGQAGSSIAETIVVGNETGSDVTFNFAEYNGTPDGTIAGVNHEADYQPTGGGVRIVGTVLVPPNPTLG